MFVSAASFLQQVSNNVSDCTEMSLYDEKLTPDDQIQLSTGLKKNTFLKKLALGSYTEFAKIAELFEALKINRSLQELELSDVPIGKPEAEALADALKVNATLNTLCLFKCALTNNIRELAEAFKVNRALQTLNLAGNQFGQAGVQVLALGLKVNTTLTSLNLNNCDLTNTAELAEALKVNRTLQELHLGWNEFGNAGGGLLAEALKINTVLNRLNLSDCKLTEIMQLAEALKVNRMLQKLDLQDNKFGDLGLQALADALNVNTTLIDLNLRSCKLTKIAKIAEVLKINRTLQKLDLMFNKFGNAGGQALAEALEVNTTLTSLGLVCCNLTEIAELTKVLKHNRVLQTLDLSYNHFGNAGGQAIASALNVNTTLINLALGSCELTKISRLAEALKVNRALQKLRLGHNQFGDVGAQALAGALKVNTTLIDIDLDGLCPHGMNSKTYNIIDERIKFNKSLAIQKSLVLQKKQLDEKERKSQAAGDIQSFRLQSPQVIASPSASPSVNVHTMLGRMLDAEVAEKLRDLPGKLEVLAQRVQRLDIIDANVLLLLQSRTDQMKRLLDGQDQVDLHNLEKARIDESAALLTYYQYFSRLLTGTWMACQTINSGMVDIDEKYTSDYVGQGLDMIGKQIPGISIVTSIISGAISAWNSREKKMAVQRLARLFPDLETAFRELSQLARQVTLAQEKEIHSLPAPKGIAAKIKEAFKDAKAFFLGNDANDLLKRKAVDDCTKLLTAIKEGKLPEKPTQDDLLSTILGKGFKYQQPALMPASPAASNPARAVATASPTPSPSASPTMQQPDLMEMIEELRRMKERDAAREAELKAVKEQMAKLQSQLPDDDSMEIGNSDAQVLISKSRQATNAASAASISNPRVAAELIDGTRRLEVEVEVIKARLELHSDVIETNKADLAKVQRDLRRK